MYPCVKFQRASSNLECLTPGDISQREKRANSENLSGVEAREFYESLMVETDNCTNSNNIKDSSEKTLTAKTSERLKKDKKLKECKKSHSFNPKNTNHFLKMAQEGDYDGLRRMIEDEKINIDTKDQFGWTALMCATASGHKSCVRLLLDLGADTEVKNIKGQTAMDIGNLVNMQEVFLETSEFSKSSSWKSAKFSNDHLNYCDICKSTFLGSKIKHDTSTSHLFNCQHKTNRTVYYIPENNIGFKLMKQKGWNQEKGLGPEGSGRKFPIKTILKLDREGLGCKSKHKAKVTHFSAGDTKAVVTKQHERTCSRKGKISWKQKYIKQKNHEKQWEHNLRLYMNTE
ncbi:G patch domain and ankyrin repeat-containing protein 1-like [Xenia sp. Carnegie-2017]|uniref:G patch domain and ankyrin repeat-containing protein 1-like n=1 Tax=Xenia sp. Carnegie-2017 TaxID=2897299 RepID=UPI001F044276|nr:G patch domain and ankyrin repeat-containing protein 1-like [Xenia sp. Carnegie-2017]